MFVKPADRVYTKNDLLNALRFHSKDMEVDLSLVTSKIDRDIFDEQWLDVFCKTHIGTTLCVLGYQWILLAGRVYAELKSKYLPSTLLQSTLALEPFLNKRYVSFIKKNHKELEAMINYDLDYTFSLPAWLTLEGTYLMKNKIGEDIWAYEKPQHTYIRVAIWNFMPDMKTIKIIYDALSNKFITVATPHYYNAGSKHPNLASCNLLQVKDSTVDIAEKWKYEALLSKNGSGIGKDLSYLRMGPISNTGVSAQHVTWLRVDDGILQAFPQGGKRAGSATCYLVATHPGILEFIDAKRTDPPYEMRANENLTYCVTWNSHILEKIFRGEDVYLVSPHLHDWNKKYGKEFAESYEKLCDRIRAGEKISHVVIPGRDLMERHALVASMTGGPFSFFKENTNRQSNTIRFNPDGSIKDGRVDQSNLCTEIVEPTDEGVASCNLASVSLPNCAVNGKMDYDKLRLATKYAVTICDRSIDRTYRYIEKDGKAKTKLIPSIRKQNKKYRPLGVGVQGMADMVALLDICWFRRGADGQLELTPEIIELNTRMAKEMYKAGIETSHELAERYNETYSRFEGTAASFGLLMPDLAILSEYSRKTGVEFTDFEKALEFLKENNLLDPELEPYREMARRGLRNAQMFAYMPTANTATLLDNNECFEMFSGLLYKRKIQNGTFTYINKHLQRDLMEINLFTPDIVSHIMHNDALSGIELPETCTLAQKERFEYLKLKYLTVYEGNQKDLLRLAADRQKYICQAQSMNLYYKEPSLAGPIWAIRDAHDLGLKTLYYTRFRSVSTAKNYSSGAIKDIFALNRAKSGTGEVCEGCVL